jgi:hypothetical protein
MQQLVVDLKSQVASLSSVLRGQGQVWDTCSSRTFVVKIFYCPQFVFLSNSTLRVACSGSHRANCRPLAGSTEQVGASCIIVMDILCTYYILDLLYRAGRLVNRAGAGAMRGFINRPMDKRNLYREHVNVNVPSIPNPSDKRDSQSPSRPQSKSGVQARHKGVVANINLFDPLRGNFVPPTDNDLYEKSDDGDLLDQNGDFFKASSPRKPTLHAPSPSSIKTFRKAKLTTPFVYSAQAAGHKS